MSLVQAEIMTAPSCWFCICKQNCFLYHLCPNFLTIVSSCKPTFGVKLLSSNGSCSLPFMVKVMVSYLMSDAHKVITALILAAFVLVCNKLI
jgi:hypothetical protein